MIEPGVDHQLVGRDPADQALLRQQGHGRGTRDRADLHLLQRLIVQRRDLGLGIGALQEHVAGAVIGIGVLGQFAGAGHPDDQVAHPRGQGVAHEAHRGGIPGVGELDPELGRQQLGDLVLEAFARLVGVGQVVGIRAHPQMAAIHQLARQLALGCRRCAAESRGQPQYAEERQATLPQAPALRRLTGGLVQLSPALLHGISSPGVPCRPDPAPWAGGPGGRGRPRHPSAPSDRRRCPRD